MCVVAIIPARGGSKGIPLKNIRRFDGMPLVATSISAALNSKYVDKVYVSTDNSHIAQCSIEYGAEVIMRPDKLGSDTVSSEEVLLDALDQLKNNGVEPHVLVFLQCTAPFLLAEDIDGTVAKMLESNADSALAVVPFNHFIWQNDSSNIAHGVNHDGYIRKRRQDLSPQFLEAGSVYSMKVEKFRQEKTRFCGNTVLYEISDPNREHEIDDPCEFFMAERKLEWFKHSDEWKIKYKNLAKEVEIKIQSIKAVVFDFDGVFTDDSVYQNQFGNEMIKCCRTDGMGISLLKKNTSLELLVLSTEKNDCVKRRCQKLGLDVIYNVQNKLIELEKWASSRGIQMNEIAYCGNDLNDMQMINNVSLFFTPQNAQPEIKELADYISDKKGGSGFVREVCNYFLRYKNYFKKVNFYSVNQYDYRPWGYWETIYSDSKKCIKRIVVNPKQRLSYQVHQFRDELWTVVTGEAQILLDDKSINLKTGDSLSIKRGQKHRLENCTSDKLLEVIEVQSGDVLRESDITRILDDYERV